MKEDTNKKSSKRRREENEEAWDTGKLGESAEHARPAAAGTDEAVDNSLGLQMLSIRLQKTLIEDLKNIATEEGLGYQPLIRQVLTKFAKERKQRAARAARLS